MGGGGGGGFSACTIFFFRPLLVQEFFLQVKPSARIFFSDKYCFVCGILILISIPQKKNYFTKNYFTKKELFYKRIVVLCWF